MNFLNYYFIVKPDRRFKKQDIVMYIASDIPSQRHIIPDCDMNRSTAPLIFIYDADNPGGRIGTDGKFGNIGSIFIAAGNNLS